MTERLSADCVVNVEQIRARWQQITDDHADGRAGPTAQLVFRLLDEIVRLRSGLREARDCVESWGAYAGDYFQEKWDLAGDLAAIDAILGPEYACPRCGKLAQSLAGDCTHNDGDGSGQ